jgi:P27 family predicted phage terminase small subunit
MGVLSVVDRAAFAGYCQSYAHAVEAEAAIVRDGLFLKGQRGKRYANPHVAIARRAWDEVRRFAIEFGMTPSSRARLDVKVPSSGDGTRPERPTPRYRFGRTPPTTA